MANTTLTSKDEVSSLAAADKIFVNAGSKVRQISLVNLNTALGVINEAELSQVAFYTDFNETGDTVLEQGGNLAMLDFIFERGGNYTLNSSGYAAKLHPNNMDMYSDSSEVELNRQDINYITMLPDFYYLVTTNKNGKPRLWISMKDIGGHYQPVQWMGTYKGSMIGTILQSVPNVIPTGGKTITQFFEAAQINGENWGLANYTMRKTLALMFFTKYGTTLSQGGSILGNGLSGVGSNYNNIRNIRTGGANSLGDGTGYVDIEDASGNRAGSVSVFGVKDPFGQVWEFVGGVSPYNDKWYISDDCVAPVDGIPSWINMRTVPRLQTGSGNYISQMQWGEYADLFPKDLGGNSTTYYTDGCWYNTNGRVLLWGGSAYYGALCGLVCAYAYNAFSFANADVGARLGFYGTPIIISGTKFNSL
ncbi:MAG TPA: hypothetical protein DDW85_03325 [Porphyromonadaceae bacterium]|nr:hypothetical protein [Porphyromonadaceae bacterium]